MRRGLLLIGLLFACGTTERDPPPKRPTCTLPICATECACDLTVACDPSCGACDPECGECRPPEAICATPTDAGPADLGGAQDADPIDGSADGGLDAAPIDAGPRDAQPIDTGVPDAGLREDLEPCSSDGECLSQDCHPLLGRCLSRPDHPCEVAVGCITPSGDRYGCDESLQPPLCVEMTRLPGSLCFAPSDCNSAHCTDGVCIGTVGDSCLDGADCFSSVCYRGVCSCSPAEPQDCAPGLTCAATNGTTPFSCEPAGTVARGQPCSGLTDCQRALICVGDGFEDTCRETCQVATGICTSPAESCWPIEFPTDIDPFFGVCVP